MPYNRSMTNAQLQAFRTIASTMNTAKTNSQYPSLGEAKASGQAWLAANPAALEIEYTVRLGNTHTIQVWVDRNGEAYDKPSDQRSRG